MNQNTDHLMVKPEAAHIITLTCAYCGGQRLIQLPMSLTVLTHRAEQFRRLHLTCQAPRKEFEG